MHCSQLENYTRRILVVVSAVPLSECPGRWAVDQSEPPFECPTPPPPIQPPSLDSHPPFCNPTPAPAVFQILLLPFVPESPRYLLVKGRNEEAEKSLARVLRMCGKTLPEGRLRALKTEDAAPADDTPRELWVGGCGGGAVRCCVVSHPPSHLPLCTRSTTPAVRKRLGRVLRNGAVDIGGSIRALFTPELRWITASEAGWPASRAEWGFGSVA
jgi:hypothetical protein